MDVTVFWGEMKQIEIKQSVEVDRDKLTNLSFALGYFHHYRHLRSRILEKDIDRIHEIFPDLKDKQVESTVSMLQVELVANAVMYCADLAVILLALRKRQAEILKTVSSLHETGSGSIKEFYEKLPQQDLAYFWRMMRYDKLKIAKEEQEKYERSCKRFRDDMLKLSKFFLHWYVLFSAYKHGLNVVALIDEKTGKDVLMIGNYDGSFDMLILSPSWYLGYIETVEIVLRMFDRVIEPIFWMMLENTAEVDLKEKRDIRKTLVSREPDETRPYKITIRVSFPWKIREAKEYKPFY